MGGIGFAVARRPGSHPPGYGPAVDGLAPGRPRAPSAPRLATLARGGPQVLWGAVHCKRRLPARAEQLAAHGPQEFDLSLGDLIARLLADAADFAAGHGPPPDRRDALACSTPLRTAIAGCDGVKSSRRFRAPPPTIPFETGAAERRMYGAQPKGLAPA